MALLTHRNHEEAARAISISVATLHRWEKDPEFQKAYRKANGQAVRQAVARLQQNTGAAATTLLKLMVDAATPVPVKARIAHSILELAIRGIENDEIEARIAELELAVRARAKP